MIDAKQVSDMAKSHRTPAYFEHAGLMPCNFIFIILWTWLFIGLPN